MCNITTVRIDVLEMELLKVVYFPREQIRKLGWERGARAEPTGIKDSHLSLSEQSVYLMDSLMMDEMIE